MKTKIDTRYLPFKIKKSKEGFAVSLEGDIAEYWGDTVEEAIVELFDKRIWWAFGEANKLKALKDILGVRL